MLKFTQNHLPVALLSYADSRKNLGNLIHEQKALRTIFEQQKGQGYIDWRERYNLEIEEIYRIFEQATPESPITIWHYAGHANDYELLLMNGRADASGINYFIAEQKSLHLVFLNACVTYAQAKDLVERGVPVVIATTEPVDDQASALFATRFYTALAAGKTIQDAFNTAKWAVRATYGAFEKDRKSQEKLLRTKLLRTSKKLFPTKTKPLSEFEPWVLLTSTQNQDEAQAAKTWTFKSSINDPYLGLPTPLIPSQDLPSDPYRSLKHYTENETELFFGRGWEIRSLYYMVTNNELSKLILLYGQSGVGKSSLLNAGVLPRLGQLQTVEYRQRDTNEGILGAFQDIFTNLKTVNGSEVLAVWKATERRLGTPLTIILDQLEELFTKPQDTSELDKLLDILEVVFRDKQNRPVGKLILSYRKEFHPEIETAFEKHPEMSYLHFFLEPLREANIVESITGMNLRAKTRHQYRLSFEPNLPEKIAHDLAKDSTSAIAPTLQILLEKMWQQVKGNKSRIFTNKLYQRTLGEGKLMEKFLNTQLALVAEEPAYTKYVRAGLALDVLHHHVTSLGTSNSHTRAHLAKRYWHLSKEMDFDGFLGCLIDHYLLTQDKNQRTSLMHDTLAPLVQKAFRNSSAKGQLAAHILEGKLRLRMPGPYLRFPFLMKTLQRGTYLIKNSEKETISIFLGGLERRIIKEGRKGMRALTARELQLVRASQRKRNLSYIEWGLGTVGVLLVVGMLLFVSRSSTNQNDGEQKTTQKTTQKMASKQDGVIRQKADSLQSQALRLLKQSDSLLQVQKEITQNHEIAKAKD